MRKLVKEEMYEDGTQVKYYEEESILDKIFKKNDSEEESSEEKPKKKLTWKGKLAIGGGIAAAVGATIFGISRIKGGSDEDTYEDDDFEEIDVEDNNSASTETEGI